MKYELLGRLGKVKITWDNRNFQGAIAPFTQNGYANLKHAALRIR